MSEPGCTGSAAADRGGGGFVGVTSNGIHVSAIIIVITGHSAESPRRRPERVTRLF